MSKILFKTGRATSRFRRPMARAALVSMLAAAAVATSVGSAEAVTVSSPCTTAITWTSSTNTKVANTNCQYSIALITRYYAGSPVTYQSSAAVAGTSKTVTSTNGTCISHGANLYPVSGDPKNYTYNC